MFCTVLWLFALNCSSVCLKFWHFSRQCREPIFTAGFLSIRDITGCQPPCDLWVETLFSQPGIVLPAAIPHIMEPMNGAWAQGPAKSWIEMFCNILFDNAQFNHDLMWTLNEKLSALRSTLLAISVVVMCLVISSSVFVCSVFELSALRKVEWYALYCFIVRYRMGTYCKLSGFAFLCYRTAKDIQPFAQP